MTAALQFDPVLTHFRAAMAEIHGDRIERVLLYGSRAATRGRIPITTLPLLLETRAASPTTVPALQASARIFSSAPMLPASPT
jgi:hypothetical protein